jgi:hypothetical protein
MHMGSRSIHDTCYGPDIPLGQHEHGNIVDDFRTGSRNGNGSSDIPGNRLPLYSHVRGLVLYFSGVPQRSCVCQKVKHAGFKSGRINM